MMKFFTDSDILIPVKWYFTNRPMLPIPHSFGNRYWSAEGGSFVDGVGEDCSSPRPWRNGSVPVEGAVMGPPHYCGTPEQWLGQMLLVDAHVPDALGRDPCCRPPPPLPIQLGLVTTFEAGSIMKADLSLDLREASRVSGRGAARPILAALGSLMSSPQGLGHLDGGLSSLITLLPGVRAPALVAPLLATHTGLLSSLSSLHAQHVLLEMMDALDAAYAASGSLYPQMAEVEGLSASTASHAGLQALLHEQEGLSLSADAVAQLAPDLGQLLADQVLLDATGRLPAGLADLTGLAVAYIHGHTWAATLAFLEQHQVVPHAPGRIAVIEALVEALKAAAHAKGVLLGGEQLREAVLAAFAGPGKEAPVEGSKAKVTASFASFGVVTPTGGCGSLPASLVARFSGFGGTATVLNGTSVTITFAVANWSGTFSPGGNMTAASLTCSPATHNWIFSMTGGYNSGFVTLSGTSGASPNLTGTVTVTGAGSGTGTVTITRT